MNAQETLTLLEALRASGATHFKSQDFEVSFGKYAHQATPLVGGSPHPLPETRYASDAGSPPVENKEATEKLKALIETVNLDDVSLLNKIFPNGAEP